MKTVYAEDIIKKRRVEKLVLTASRRTDMPAFYTAELIAGLNEGVFHPQPLMNEMYELKFKPEMIHSINLWSQDFSEWLRRKEEIKWGGYNFYYRFTILPDNPVIKPVAPTVREQLRQLELLVKGNGSEAVSVHIDPLLKYRNIGDTGWRKNFSSESLDGIISGCADAGIENISFSVIDYSRKAARKGKASGIEFRFYNEANPVDRKEIIEMASELAESADKSGMKLFSCCERFISERGICGNGACVDGRKLNAVFGNGASVKADGGQRRKFNCLCTRSLDIGRYISSGKWSHVCYHNCPQCYARG